MDHNRWLTNGQMSQGSNGAFPLMDDPSVAGPSPHPANQFDMSGVSFMSAMHSDSSSQTQSIGLPASSTQTFPSIATALTSFTNPLTQEDPMAIVAPTKLSAQFPDQHSGSTIPRQAAGIGSMFHDTFTWNQTHHNSGTASQTYETQNECDTTPMQPDLSRETLCRGLITKLTLLKGSGTVLSPSKECAINYIIANNASANVVSGHIPICGRAVLAVVALWYSKRFFTAEETMAFSVLLNLDSDCVEKGSKIFSMPNENIYHNVDHVRNVHRPASQSSVATRQNHVHHGRVSRTYRSSRNPRIRNAEPSLPTQVNTIIRDAQRECNLTFGRCTWNLTPEAILANKQKSWDEAKQFSCLAGCGKTFERSSDFTRHMQTVRPWHGWICNCPKEVSHEDGSVVCSSCNEVNPVPSHYKDAHPKTVPCDEREIKVRLGRSGRLFFRESHVKNHFASCHSSVTAGHKDHSFCFSIPGNFEPLCGFCGKAFRTCMARLTHIIKHFKRRKTMDQWKEPWEGDALPDEWPDEEIGNVSNDEDDDDDNDDDGHDNQNNDDNDDPHGAGDAGNSHGNSDSASFQRPRPGASGSGTQDESQPQTEFSPSEFFQNFKSLCDRCNGGTSPRSYLTTQQLHNVLRTLWKSTTTNLARHLRAHPHASVLFRRDRAGHYLMKQMSVDDVESHTYLGFGGSSVVDKVRLTGEDIFLARKQMKFEEQEVGMLLQEFAALSRVSHRHVIRLEGIILRHRTCSLLVSPAADGNLSNLLQAQKLKPQFGLRRLGCIALAVRAIHQAGMTHGDIKPGNILVRKADDDIKLWLCDFGASFDGEVASKSIWTPRFAAPEEGRNTRPEQAADIFSLACVFLEVIFSIMGSIGSEIPLLARDLSDDSFRYGCRINEVREWLLGKAQSSESARTSPLSAEQWRLLAQMFSEVPSKRPRIGDVINAFTADVCCTDDPLVVHHTDAVRSIRSPSSSGGKRGHAAGQLSYEHSPLNEKSRTIRLLQLHTHNGGEIEATMKQVSLDDKPAYCALSYTWGDLSQGEQIFIDGRRLLVNTNAHEALKALSRDGTCPWLWVDQICIDQNNVEERNHQVALMSDIYGLSKSVLIWLGDLGEATWHAVHLIHDFLLDRELSQNPKRTKYDLSLLHSPLLMQPSPWDLQSSIRHFSKVIEARWFSRMWVVQELALAEHASIMCGKKLLDFKIVSTVMAGLSTLAPDKHHFSRPNSKRTVYEPVHIMFKSNKEYQTFERAWETSSASTSLRMLLETQESSVDLLDLLSYFRSYDCLDARDRVYGLLGLRLDFDRYGLTPKYNMSTDDVYLMTAKALLESGQVNVLAFCGQAIHGVYARILPSWAPDWSAEHREQIFMKTFSVSSGAKIHRSASCYFEEPNVLSIAGAFIDEIDEVSSLAISDDVEALLTLKTSLRRKATVCDRYNDLTEAFLRTTIADRQPQHLRGWRRAGRWASGFLSTKLAKPQDRELPPEFLSTAKMFLGSKIIFCTTRGHIGLGPKELRKGDVAVILFGASVPFVLRPTKRGHYVLVGDCYVHGLMDGEFMRNDPVVQTFQIV